VHLLFSVNFDRLYMIAYGLHFFLHFVDSVGLLFEFFQFSESDIHKLEISFNLGGQILFHELFDLLVNFFHIDLLYFLKLF
jgi:hypothetical protein